MNLVKTLAAGVVALAAMSTATLAADVMPIMPAAPAPIVVPPVVPQPTWTGAYFGTTGGITFSPESEGPWKNLGVIGGYDLQFGSRFLTGVSVRTTIVSPLSGSPFVGILDATLQGRAGVLLGSDQRLLVYGTGGLGITIGNVNLAHLTYGGGVEFAITDRIHTFAQFEHASALGGGNLGNTIQFGLTLR